ncbi:hypothetical protein [Saccharothrix obliqua]|uniref:hypothetical protein n=1 Tax=Saccharothrix obliqua TaxID=2861747 RepID=UPI001C5D8D35|nr:hypothetical protein [Saccharothrix obliqua]MBW4719968.1 hypothetical protein [Saccharothrix obliqua]
MIILDNMAVLGARNALRPEFPVYDEDVRKPHDKWDFALTDRLRHVADIACLGQLVQAVVLHDVIGLSPLGGGSTGPLPPELDGLAEVVRPVLPDDDHRPILLHAAERAYARAGGEDFKDHVARLRDHPVVGAFVQVSNGHFGTGFSDVEQFTDLREVHDYYGQVATTPPRRRTAADRVLRRPHQPLVGGFAELELRSRVTYRVARGLGHPFEKSHPGDERFQEHADAGLDVLRHVAATNYHADLALLVDAWYAPHPLRAPLTDYGAADPLSAADRRRLRHLLGHRRGAKLARRHVTTEADVALPLLLAHVLERAASPDDVVPVALELRATRPARRLRAWFAEVEERLAGGGLAADQVADRLRALADASDAFEPDHRVGVRLGIGPLSTRRLPRFAGRPRRLRFGYDLTRVTESAVDLAPLLRRALGEDSARAWEAGRELFGTSGPAAAVDKRQRSNP